MGHIFPTLTFLAGANRRHPYSRFVSVPAGPTGVRLHVSSHTSRKTTFTDQESEETVRLRNKLSPELSPPLEPPGTQFLNGRSTQSFEHGSRGLFVPAKNPAMEPPYYNQTHGPTVTLPRSLSPGVHAHTSTVSIAIDVPVSATGTSRSDRSLLNFFQIFSRWSLLNPT